MLKENQSSGSKMLRFNIFYHTYTYLKVIDFINFLLNTRFKAIVTSGGLPRKWTTVNDIENLSGIFNLLYLNLEVDPQCSQHFLHTSFRTRISLCSSGY